MDGKMSKNKIKVIGKTSKGKEIGTRETGENRFKEAVFVKGGQIPAELKGGWTDPVQLEAAIGVYLDKEKMQAEKESKMVSKKVRHKNATS